jgi:tRNA(His) guanylyltransferase
MQDSLGDRMKDYEGRSRFFLPRRGYTMIRLDGKAFHTYTRGFDRPFDYGLIDAMNQTAQFLCSSIQGCCLAYAQSDEITLVLVDFLKTTSDAWFQGNLQKIASISASMATAKFLEVRRLIGDERLAFFDSRAWFLADPIEVENTFIWRQKDATRNSIQLVAQSLYSHKELHNKNTSQLQEMIFQKDINWNDYPAGMKRGRVVKKVYYQHTSEFGSATRSRWDIVEPPIFTKDRSFLREMIPTIESW